MRRFLAALLAAAAAAAAGCGVGEGEEREGAAELRVTRDFGRERLGQARLDGIREGDTVMRALRRRFEVSTRFGGRFVQSIDGVEGRGAGGRRDWLYFVNGVEAGVGAAEYELSAGDVVQWDYRRWDVAQRVPAIVGAFPEPFRRGTRGERLPVRVQCDDAAERACDVVKRRLADRGVKAGGGSLDAPPGEELARVLVGPWRRLRSLRSVRTLEDGPEENGVFARFARDGGGLELLDAGGDTARRAPAGTGLVAALAPMEGEVVWVVTGVDGAGVRAAAGALDERALRDAYAVSAGPGGVEKLPLGGD